MIPEWSTQQWIGYLVGIALWCGVSVLMIDAHKQALHEQTVAQVAKAGVEYPPLNTGSRSPHRDQVYAAELVKHYREAEATSEAAVTAPGDDNLVLARLKTYFGAEAAYYEGLANGAGANGTRNMRSRAAYLLSERLAAVEALRSAGYEADADRVATTDPDLLRNGEGSEAAVMTEAGELK